MPVERTLICPPRCRIRAITPEERAAVRSRSPAGAEYDVPVNRESAYEILARRAAPGVAPSAPVGAAPVRPSPAEEPKKPGALGEFLWGTKRRHGMVETIAKQAARTVESQVGREILRGVLEGILGGARRR